MYTLRPVCARKKPRVLKNCGYRPQEMVFIMFHIELISNVVLSTEHDPGILLKNLNHEISNIRYFVQSKKHEKKD